MWGGLVQAHTGVSAAPCTRVALIPTASDSSEAFGAVNSVLIDFFLFAIAMLARKGSAENPKEGTQGFPSQTLAPALPEKREGKKKVEFDETTEQQLTAGLSLGLCKSISAWVGIRLISKEVNLIIACAEKEKPHNPAYCHRHPKHIPWLNQIPFNKKVLV